MTQTFSQILEEKMKQDTGFLEGNQTLFYSGTIESASPFRLPYPSFPVKKTFVNGTQYPSPHPLVETTTYQLSKHEQQAVDFFNQYLPMAKQLNGQFSLWRMRRTFLLLAKKFHPDVGGTPELFRELHSHYKILLDFLKLIK